MDAFNRFIYEIIIQNTINNAQTGPCYFYDLCYVLNMYFNSWLFYNHYLNVVINMSGVIIVSLFW